MADIHCYADISSSTLLHSSPEEIQTSKIVRGTDFKPVKGYELIS